MFYEEIEQWTKAQFSGDLHLLLAVEQAKHADGLQLRFPVTIDTSSVLGGVVDARAETLPQYAIDCELKELAPPSEDGWFYDYSGHITVMVWADRASHADALCKRHVKVIETWIRSHLYPQYRTEEFVITEMRYSSTTMGGAIPLTNTEAGNGDVSQEGWIAGAEVNLAWRVAENGPYQET